MPLKVPPVAVGAILGGLLGGVYGAVRMACGYAKATDEMLFTGVVQGSDQLVYMGLNQAIWRAGNGLTYSYPFTLPPDSTPPILFQSTFALTSAIGLLTGLPIAYEVMRTAGASACGALLALVARQLLPAAKARRSFLSAAVFGGSLFWIKGLGLGLQEAGLDSLTWPTGWHEKAAGPFYWWLPHLLPNIRLPIEPLNHVMVFGVLTGFGARRPGWACLAGLGGWLTNPFPGLLGSMVGCALEGLGFLRRVRAGAAPRPGWLRCWAAITGAGLLYYGPFQNQWRDLAEVSRLCRMELAPPPSILDMACLIGPWALGLLFVPQALRRGKNGDYRHPLAAGLAIMAVGQILLQVQGWIPGWSPFQPYHFNRGYLVVSLAGLTALSLPGQLRLVRRLIAPLSGRSGAGDSPAPMLWRRLISPLLGGWKVRRTRALIGITIITAPDPLAFLSQDVWSTPPLASYIAADEARALDYLKDLPQGPRVVLYDVPHNLFIASFSPHVPYSSSHWIAFPFASNRDDRLKQALEEADRAAAGDPYLKLGINVVMARESETGVQQTDRLQRLGWSKRSFGRLAVWLPPGAIDAARDNSGFQ